MHALSDITTTGRAVASEFSDKNVTFMAGSIAYNAFVSIAPLLVVCLLAVRIFGGEASEAQVIAYTGRFLPGAVGTVVEKLVEGSGGTSVSLIGLLVATWGSLKIFRNLDTAFSEIYETESKNSLPDQLRDALVVLFALLVGVVGMVLVNAAFGAYQQLPFVGVLGPIVLLFGLCIAFFPLFYVFPDTDHEPREVIPGLLVAAVGWAALQAVFQIYVRFKFDDPSDAATLGLLLLVVTWLYFSGLVLLLGAVVNAVRTGHAGPENASGAPFREETHAAEAERDLSAAAAATYLTRLRADISGREEVGETTDGDRPRPTPTGEIRVTEGPVADGEGADGGAGHWVVRLRYPYEAED